MQWRLARRRRWAAAMTVALFSICGLLSAQSLPFSISASKKFRVFSESSELRAAFCMRCDEYSKRFHEYTGLTPIETPIVIRLHLKPKPGPAEDQVRPMLRIAGRGLFHAQLDVQLNREFRWEEVGEEVTQLLLSLHVLEGKQTLPETELLPWWLGPGVWEGMQSRQRGRPSDDFRIVVQAGRHLPLSLLLGKDPAARTEIRRASAEAFVHSLLTQNKGRPTFEKFIKDLPFGTRESQAVLRRHWVNLQNSREELEQWWALQATLLAEPGPFEMLDIEETEAALAQSLWLSTRVAVLKKAEGIKRTTIAGLPVQERQPPRASLDPSDDTPLIHLTNYETLLRHPRRLEIATAGMKNLGVAKTRSNPLYQPIFLGYSSVLEDIGLGEDKDLGARLHALAAARDAVRERMKAVDHFMDWHEATGGAAKRGSFDEYLRIAEKAERPPAKRSDPISQYLDAVELELQAARSAP